MELITIIVVIVVITKLMKKGQAEKERIERNTVVQNPWDQVGTQTKSAQSTYRSSSSNSNEQWKQAARANIEKAKKSAENKFHEIESEVLKEKVSKNDNERLKQVEEGRIKAKNTSIMERAKKNADEDKADVILETMEAEHNHSERVASAEHHHSEDVLPESMLGNIEDLMIKGYDGNLCFERDFVGEAMDMINRFSVPTDIPDFSKDDVA